MCFKDISEVSAAQLIRSSMEMELSAQQSVYSPASLLVLLTALLGTRGPRGVTEQEMRRSVGVMVTGELDPWFNTSIGEAEASRYVTEMAKGLDQGPEQNCLVWKGQASPYLFMENKRDKDEPPKVPDDARMCLSNILLLDDQLTVKERFQERLTKEFRFQLISFNKEEEKKLEAVKEANGIIDRTTSGVIKDFLEVSDLQSDMILVNALYVEANFVTALRKSNQISEFRTSATSDPSRMHMYEMLSKNYPYYQEEERNIRVVEIPLKSNDLTFFVILPLKPYSESLLNLREQELFEIDSKLKSTKINLRIPSFKSESELDLVQPLKNMGMLSMFDPFTANFSGISDTPLFVSNVKQVASFELNEFGIKAAAATSMSMMSASYNPIKPIDFHCTEPFKYVLMRKSTRKLLFVGVYNQPDMEHDGFSKVIV